MSEMKFTAIYEPVAEGGYVGYVAELPGANTQGETIEEARENLRDAVEMLLDCYREDAETHLAGTPLAKKEDLILQAL
jgi:predicted RNase H-like HicB family nuclease